jgi:hypothetical protein
MRKFSPRSWQLFAAFGVLSWVATPFAAADEYPRERNSIYNQNLDYVNQALEKRKAKLLALTADLVETGSGPVESLSGHAYRAGDEWDTVSYYSIQNALPGGEARTDFAPRGKISSFHYRVVAVAPLKIEVTETTKFGARKTDPKVASVTLDYDTDFHEIGKSYRLINGQTVNAFVHGMHSRGLPLEIYEIDAPDVTSADPVAYQAPEELIASMPTELAAIAHALKFTYDAPETRSMQTVDGFGRAVEFVWPKGSPWPAYVKTERGISLLVGSGAQ